MEYSEARAEWNDFCDEFIEENVEPKDRGLFEEGGFHNEFWYGFIEGKFKKLQEAEARAENKMPLELTAENGAKALLIGEFKESFRMICPVCNGEESLPDEENCRTCDSKELEDLEVMVSWTNIKEIYKMAVKHFTEPPKEGR